MRTPHSRDSALAWPPIRPPHTAASSTPYIWDTANEAGWSDSQISIMCRMMNNSIITPVVKSVRANRPVPTGTCPHHECSTSFTVEHMLNLNHIDSNSQMIRQIQAINANRHAQLIEVYKAQVLANLREGVYIIQGDQCSTNTNTPVSQLPMDSNIRAALQAPMTRYPDNIVRVVSPSMGTYLLWMEMTTTTDANIYREELLFKDRRWQNLLARYTGQPTEDRNNSAGFFNYPYSCWHPDGENAGCFQTTARPLNAFTLPEWAPKVRYSPRAKIMHRTLRKRTLLEHEHKLYTRTLTIEIGHKGYMSQLSIQEMQAELKPIVKHSFSVAALRKQLTKVVLDHAIQVGEVLYKFGYK